MRLPAAVALFVLAILVAQLLASCDLDEWRGSEATGKKVGEVHQASKNDPEEEEPAEEEPVEEEPPAEEPVDPNGNEACWGDISYETWLEESCPGDPPPR
jgi:outer membrane biosynthesis protein TonB